MDKKLYFDAGLMTGDKKISRSIMRVAREAYTAGAACYFFCSDRETFEQSGLKDNAKSYSVLICEGKEQLLTKLKDAAAREDDVIAPESFVITRDGEFAELLNEGKVVTVGAVFAEGDYERLIAAGADFITAGYRSLREFALRGMYDKALVSTGSLLADFLFPVALFFIAKYAVAVALLGLFSAFRSTGADIFASEADCSAIASALGITCGMLINLRRVRTDVRRAEGLERLRHIFEQSVICKISFLLSALMLAGGLNLLTGFVSSSGDFETFSRVSSLQGSASLPVTLICYILLAPLGEELFFRGILFNSLKLYGTPLSGIIISSVLFGVYHGNLLQGVYAALMGVLIAWGYYSFGDIRYAVAAHIAANAGAMILNALLKNGILEPNLIVMGTLLAAGIAFLAIFIRTKRY